MMDRKGYPMWMTEKYWRKNKLAHSFVLLSVVGLAATGGFAVEDSAKLAGAGLNGIFPTTPPSDLSEEEFAKLDGNWAEWSKGAAAAVADFYKKVEGTDPAAQRQALGVLKVKLDVMRRALDDNRYSSIHGQLSGLYTSLSLRAELAEAALDTLGIDGVQLSSSRSKARANEVVSAISALESDLAPIPNGQLWIPYFKIDALKAALSADPQAAPAREAAKASQALLNSRDYVLDETQKKFTHRNSFDVLADAVSRYLAVTPWVDAGEGSKNLRNEFKALVESLDSYVTGGVKASDVRHAFARVRYVAPDGGDRLASTLQERLFNYNLRILATEDFLNRLISSTRCETGLVRDCILGAAVSGCQMTNTTVSVDLKPSNTTARFNLQLNGTVQSNTVGVTPQANVWTSGYHRFVASKEINYDGNRFTTAPATISVSPHNTTTGVSTKFSWVPILGRIANNIASNEVEKKRGEAEAIAASRVQDAVLPRYNSEVNASFASSADRLEKEFFAGLRGANIYPDTYTYQTSDKVLAMNARLMTDNQIGANVPASILTSVTGARALLHESVVNNAIDQIGLAGQTLTEPELRAKIEEFLSKALNRPFKFEAPPASETSQDEDEKKLSGIIFAPTDPIRVRMQNGQLVIIIRAGFKQEGKEDIPMREINVPITFNVVGKTIEAKRGNVIVAAAEGQGGGIAVNTVVRKKIQSVLPDRIVDSKVEFKTPEKTVNAYVTDLKMVDGWAAVSID